MRTIDDFVTTIHDSGVAQSGPGQSLRRGWDYWIPGQPHTDGSGATREPRHWLLEKDKLPIDRRPILDGTMSAILLLGGIWRQCLIRPGDRAVKNAEDVFAVKECVPCTRTENLVPIVGHPPSDLALYLDFLRLTDAQLFRLVLAKDFKAAIALRPDAIAAPWPSVVRQSWDPSRRDYLPPFLVAVLYAELARLANNHAGLLELSLAEGKYLNTARFMNHAHLTGSDEVPAAVERLVEMSAFQTAALFEHIPSDHKKGFKELRTLGQSIGEKSWIVTPGGKVELVSTTPRTADVQTHRFAMHPAMANEARKTKGAFRYNRPAATYWGLNSERHAATGLIEIMTSAQQWNTQYRPDGPVLKKITRAKKAQAMMAINFGWLFECSPEAAAAKLRAMTSASGDAPDNVELGPLSIISEQGEKSGDEFYRAGEEEVTSRPGPGEFGYTARYLPHLWIDTVGDDIDRHMWLVGQRVRLDAPQPTSKRDDGIGRVRPEVVEQVARGIGLTKSAKPKHKNAPKRTVSNRKLARISQNLLT